MAAFWRLLDAELRETLGVTIDRAASIELDSSSAAKFSRHVTVALRAAPPDARSPCAVGEFGGAASPAAAKAGGGMGDGGGEVLFEGNAHVGAWVRGWLARLRERARSCADARLLFAHGASASPPDGALSAACLIDASVYSRHRCFRLYGSSKAGKGTPLLPLGLSGNDALLLPLSGEERLFSRSFVCPPDCAAAGDGRVLPTAIERGGVEPVQSGREAGGCAAARHAAACSADNCALAAGAWARGVRDAAVRLPDGGGEAPCPPSGGGEALGALRAFAARAWHLKSGLPCAIGPARLVATRAPAAGDGSACLCLCVGVLQNRWCGRIGREHRSNGVYLHVRVHRPPGGVAGASCGRAVGCLSQRCHDVDCRAFRGDELPLPDALALALTDALCGPACGDGARR